MKYWQVIGIEKEGDEPKVVGITDDHHVAEHIQKKLYWCYHRIKIFPVDFFSDITDFDAKEGERLKKLALSKLNTKEIEALGLKT